MKISLDGGALCGPFHNQYGTYRFSSELIRALQQYSYHNYTAYTFCKHPFEPGSHVTFKQLFPATAWMSLRIPAEEILNHHDIFLGLNQAIPRFVHTKLIAFSHGLSFLKFPEYYEKEYSRLRAQLEDYVKRSHAIVVSSQRVKKELLSFQPDLKEKITIIPFGLPESYTQFSLLKVHKEPFFLYVGSDQLVKNIPQLFAAFEQVRSIKKYEDYSLIIVGTKLEKLPKGVKQYLHADLRQLQKLYSSACAYVAVSHYESFNFPVIEALSLGCPVIGFKSAIIPEQRPFTVIAEDLDELVDFMKHAADGSLPAVDTKQIKEKFSWERYVRSLEKLYNKV